MMIQRTRHSLSLHTIILSIASLLLPRSQRAEWLGEWKSELWYALQSSGNVPRHKCWDRTALLFCLGSFKDAIWLRRNSCNPNTHQHRLLQTPLKCLFFLATMAAITTCDFFHSDGLYQAILRNRGVVTTSQILLVVLALVGVRATTSFALSDCPTKPNSFARASRIQRWMFLGIKFVLVLLIVFCGTLELTPIISATGFQPHVTLIVYVLAFRWALIDQRRRCPVCLRILSNPARIGQPSQILTGWYGTEYFCEKGHGLMYVPEIRTTYSKQRWLDLDASWGNLFS
jgi:hypothetical protein